MKSNIKKWRTNCVVTYPNQYYANLYRIKVLSVLENVALFRGIDCATKVEYPFGYDDDLFPDNGIKEYVSDIVYFRSSSRTRISSKDFREIILHIFDEHRILGFGAEFDVDFLFQKDLPRFPYPTD